LSVPASAATQTRVHRVTTVAGALDALTALDSAPWVGIDTETRKAGEGTKRYQPGLDPYLSRIRLLQLGTATDAYVLDTTQVDPTAWMWWLKDNARKLVGQNARFDLALLQQEGLFIPRVWDTYLADRMLRPDERGGSSLEDIAKRYLGLRLDKTLQASDWGRELTDAQWEYAGQDVTVLPRLRAVLEERIKRLGMLDVARIEFEAVPAFAMLVRTGFVLDQDRWKALWDKAEADLADVERQLLQILPSGVRQGVLFGAQPVGVNLKSPDQVRDALARLGIAVESTDEHHLKALGHPVAAMLLKHRELATRLKMFFRPMLGYVHPLTGRVHSEYWQLGAASGRTTSSNPNLQQIPREAEVRGCFGVAPGHVLVVADYSQIELRIAAEVSGDERMIDAFRRGVDIHRQTAALVTGKDLNEVTKSERQTAKSLNFGLLFGMSWQGLQTYAKDVYGVEMTTNDAELFRTRYFEAYPGIASWQHRQLWRAKKYGGVRTLGGRWRPLPEAGLTRACNSPVQGCGSDMLKLALGQLAPIVFSRGWQIISEVHDEISLEVPADEGEEARTVLSAAMVGAGERYLKKVPVEAAACLAKSWADK